MNFGFFKRIFYFDLTVVGESKSKYLANPAA